MLITSGKSDYDVKPLKQLKFFGGKMHILPLNHYLGGGQLPPLPPTSRVHVALSTTFTQYAPKITKFLKNHAK